MFLFFSISAQSTSNKPTMRRQFLYVSTHIEFESLLTHSRGNYPSARLNQFQTVINTAAITGHQT